MTGDICGERCACAEAAQVERAVFTSIRSPTGQGYRIIAASSGITADEKRAITRCAPSHGSLCDPSPGATGLASFVLDNGRRCILLSQNAGIEDTARGGCRIHTHVLIMDAKTYRRFNCNPLDVEAAIRSEIGDDSDVKESARLEPLSLCACKGDRKSVGGGVVTAPAGSGMAPVKDDYERVEAILSALLRELAAEAASDDCAGPDASDEPTADGALLVVGAPSSRDLLRWLLAATPVAMRERLSVSCDLKFSPSRRLKLVLTDATPTEIARIARTHQVSPIKWKSPPAAMNCPFEPWLGLVRRGWESGRIGDVTRIALELRDDCSPDLLKQTVQLIWDTERARAADQPLLGELIQQHLTGRPPPGLPERLLNEFRQVSAARQAALEEAEQNQPIEGEKAVSEHP
jgi:hypothetical protein